MSVRASLVSGILPVLPDGRMLLLKRPAGTWEPPAGRLTPGEDFATGASRELHEETGLSLVPDLMLATWVGPRPADPNGLLASVFYASRAPASSEHGVLLSEEHLDHRWVSVEQWLALPSWWSQENILRLPRALEPLSQEPAAGARIPLIKGVDEGEVVANLGAGTALADLNAAEPRALLMRRRKPPVGLWENPGGMLEPGEDFAAAARRETLEETGVDVLPGLAWWARVEPWRGPGDHELYAGVGFVSRYNAGEIKLEDAAHDEYLWAVKRDWQSLDTWYKPGEIENLWSAIERLRAIEHEL